MGSLRRDFEPTLWFSALTFQGIVGRSLAASGDLYARLFRADGFAKPKAELLADKRLRKIMPDTDEIARDAKFTAFTSMAESERNNPPQVTRMEEK